MRNPSRDLLVAGFLFVSGAAVAEEGSAPMTFQFSDSLLSGGEVLFSARSAVLGSPYALFETHAAFRAPLQAFGLFSITPHAEFSHAVRGTTFAHESLAHVGVEASLQAGDQLSFDFRAQKRFDLLSSSGSFAIDVSGTFMPAERMLVQIGVRSVGRRTHALFSLFLQF